jgi:hypothetical protein
MQIVFAVGFVVAAVVAVMLAIAFLATAKAAVRSGIAHVLAGLVLLGMAGVLVGAAADRVEAATSKPPAHACHADYDWDESARACVRVVRLETDCTEWTGSGETHRILVEMHGPHGDDYRADIDVSEYCEDEP